MKTIYLADLISSPTLFLQVKICMHIRSKMLSENRKSMLPYLALLYADMFLSHSHYSLCVRMISEDTHHPQTLLKCSLWKSMPTLQVVSMK